MVALKWNSVNPYAVSSSSLSVWGSTNNEFQMIYLDLSVPNAAGTYILHMINVLQQFYLNQYYYIFY